jgi:hypothetical protein
MFHSSAVSAPPAAAVLVALLTISSAAAAAQGTENLLFNPGAEQGKGDQPSVWDQAAILAKGLSMQRTFDSAHTGKASLTIANEHQYDQTVCNNWVQSLQQVPHGALIRLRAAIRTRDADAANVCLQCWDASGSDMLAFASTPVFRGDQDWIEVTSTPIIVPAKTMQIMVRAALTGQGQAWFDDLQVLVEQPAERQVLAPSSATPSTLPSTKTSTSDSSLPDNLPGRLVQAVPISRDCMVLAYLPDWNYGNVDNIGIANNQGGVRALLAWEPFPAGLLQPESRRAYLAVFSRKTTAAANAADLTVAAYPIVDAWPEKTSWQTQPKINESQFATNKFVVGDGWKLFDVTALLRNRDDANRNGVMLKFENEQQTEQDWSGYALVSREGLGDWETRHPQLLIIEPDGP